MRQLILIFGIYFAVANLQAQTSIFELGLWKHTALNGTIALDGLYRAQETILRNGVTEEPETKNLTAEFEFLSRSYIWHPSFLKLDIELAFNPGVKNENFLVMPNRSETRTAEKIRIQSILFDQRPLSLQAFAGYSHGYINREYTSSIKTIRFDYGGGISFRNDLLPLTINYLNSDWDQKEISTGRVYYNLRENLRGEINKSFGQRDRNQLSIDYDDYLRKYGPGSVIHNYSTCIRLSNNFTFNEQRNSLWQSLISYRNQEGSQPFQRLQFNQNTRINLPVNAYLTALYRYVDYNQNLFKNNQHHIRGQLGHQLFTSLRSSAFYEYIDIKHTSYSEISNRAGIILDYKKSLPTGVLNLIYEYRNRDDNRNSKPGIRKIIGEIHELTDDRLVLLENPDAEELSVLVWDENRTILFENNIDYYLIARGDYLEIQRLPGGNIMPGQTVQIDYSVLQLTSFKFDTYTHMFRASITLFNRLIESYFRMQEQDYGNIVMASDKVLKVISQRVYGLRITWKMITAGWEADDYKSNIVPYRSTRYFFNISHNLGWRFHLNLNGNWRDHKLIAENESQKFADISGRFGYNFTRTLKLDINGGYRFQDGRGIDLDLSNLRMELSKRVRNLYLSAGIEIYRRNFSGEIINYNGGYFRVERKF
ncbi:MAG: hypothetical protein GQ561_06230 [Calditrichae bacterium]|nr:hypothetical protein [Calditrichia bacterium]